jgi:hypothetical protein
MIIAAGLAVNAAMLAWICLKHPALNADFRGFWSYPRFTPLAQIYTPDAMMHFQQALYPGFRSYFPFTYPPDALLALSWMRGLSYDSARTLWTLAGMGALAAAGAAMFPRRPAAMAALLASPAVLLTLALGQTSLFAAALLLAGLAALPRRQVLAGVLFGLLTLKPQMGLLLPFLLLGLGAWRAIAAAALTAGVLVALSCVLLPPELWHSWAASLPAIQSDYFAGGTNLALMVSPEATLLRLGVGQGLAATAQLLCAAVLAWAVFRTARHAPYTRATALVLAATCLAQPHAYAYDTVALPAALALWLDGAPGRAAWALAALLYLAPLALLTPAAPWFVYAMPLALLAAALALPRRGGAHSPP